MPTAPIVLIAPAMAVPSRFYRPVERAFAAAGWTARTLPRRGFEPGDARASRRHDWSYADEIATMGAAVAEARAGGGPVLTLGHSLGGQLSLGQQLAGPPADALVMLGACLPHHRHYAFGGPHLAAMAGLLVPVSTALWGYLPKPLFGAPGARTLMREWARMALTGRPPYPTDHLVAEPALVLDVEGDGLAPRAAVDVFARRFFANATQETLRRADAPSDAAHGHLEWVREPGPVVDRVTGWWAQRTAAPAAA